jgi:hypothetical protein
MSILGEIFWIAYSVAMLISLGLTMSIRAPAKILAGVNVASLAVCGLAIAAPRLSVQSIGKIMLISIIGVMYLVLFSVLARGRK